MLTGKDWLFLMSGVGSIDTILMCQFSSSLLETFRAHLENLLLLFISPCSNFLKFKGNIVII